MGGGREFCEGCHGAGDDHGSARVTTSRAAAGSQWTSRLHVRRRRQALAVALLVMCTSSRLALAPPRRAAPRRAATTTSRRDLTGRRGCCRRASAFQRRTLSTKPSLRLQPTAWTHCNMPKFSATVLCRRRTILSVKPTKS